MRGEARGRQRGAGEERRDGVGRGCVVLVDYETTGLRLGEGPDAWHEPVEVACVRVDPDTRQETGAWTRLIRPRHLERADPRAMRLHGLRPGQLLVADEAGTIVTAMEDWIWSPPPGLWTGASVDPGRFCLIAHNAAFDSVCHAMLLNRAGLPDDRHGTFACTARSDLLTPRGGSGRAYSTRLADLAVRAGIARSHHHRALGDARLLLALIQRAPASRWSAFVETLPAHVPPTPGSPVAARRGQEPATGERA